MIPKRPSSPTGEVSRVRPRLRKPASDRLSRRAGGRESVAARVSSNVQSRHGAWNDFTCCRSRDGMGACLHRLCKGNQSMPHVVVDNNREILRREPLQRLASLDGIGKFEARVKHVPKFEPPRFPSAPGE